MRGSQLQCPFQPSLGRKDKSDQQPRQHFLVDLPGPTAWFPLPLNCFLLAGVLVDISLVHVWPLSKLSPVAMELSGWSWWVFGKQSFDHSVVKIVT